MNTYQVAYTYTIGSGGYVRQNVIESVEAETSEKAIEQVRALVAQHLPKAVITFIRANRNTPQGA